MHLVFLTPSPDPVGGGSSFNAGIIPALRALHHTVDLHHDAAGLPGPAIPVIDGLLLPSLEPHLDALLEQDAVAIIHHLAAAAGQDKSARLAVLASERRMLPLFRRVVATSRPVAARLTEEFGIAEPRILTPGLPDFPRASGSGDPTCHILAIGVLTPRKRHDLLLRCLAGLIDLDWRLTIAGDAQRDPVHAAALAALVDELQLQSRVTILPDPTSEALATLWPAADLFALASSWEGYPASVAEALRRGIPVIATEVGEVPALVGRQSGMVCQPDDLATYGKCLRRMIFDTTLRRTYADAAWNTGQNLPGWPRQALTFETILRS